MSRDNLLNTNEQTQPTRMELKYQIDKQLSSEIQEWAKEHIAADPHCSEPGCDSYRVSTLYFDNPELDEYHRTGLAGNTKHRIRCYEETAQIWLEAKSKKKCRVSKRRTNVSADEFQHSLKEYLSSSQTFDQSWPGYWFLNAVDELRLISIVGVQYQRFARTEVIQGESLRLTIDSELQAASTTSCLFRDTLPLQSIETPDILELKFHNRMPLLFKQLLSQFPLTCQGFSKYRTSVEVCVNNRDKSELISCA
ncbi:MAG: polyphosphate polymerase domain-containing protein [Planctomycetaceae bacterium]